VLSEVYRIQCIFFGTPPESFSWRFKGKSKSKKEKQDKKDKDSEGKEDSDAEGDMSGEASSSVKEYNNLTPLQFVKEFVPKNVSDNISIIHDPRNEYGKMYTVDRLGNVIDGRPVAYLNLPIQDLKLYTAKTIAYGEVS
jgi:bleomycin hydrolase